MEELLNVVDLLAKLLLKSGTLLCPELYELVDRLVHGLACHVPLEPAGQGKKLGFIAQEMGREINTTGSKSNQAEMQNIVVKMKDELEQIKEQVLNAL